MVCTPVQRCTSFLALRVKPEIWTYPRASPVGYTSMADNSGPFAKAEPDKRPRSTTATVVRQNGTQQTKNLDDAILPRHRFALPHEEAATKGGFTYLANRGIDSEAIISPIPFATKVLTHTCLSSPCAFAGELLRDGCLCRMSRNR